MGNGEMQFRLPVVLFPMLICLGNGLEDGIVDVDYLFDVGNGMFDCHQLFWYLINYKYDIVKPI